MSRATRGAPIEAVERAEGEAARILRWRAEGFEEIGCDQHDASILAMSDADLHEAARLVEGGCPPELLVRILA